MSKKIPITIITGFLGAGKTTFLNRLIQKHPKQFVIIENEFGEINIDSDIVVGVQDSDLFELSNGCICCSSNAEFGIVLNKLIYEHETLEHIIVETTGIANPAAIVESLIGDAHIMQKVEIDSIICIVDALNIAATLSRSLEARKQILLSDLIVINKTDLVNERELQITKDEVKKINPSVEMIDVEHGDFDHAKVIERFDFSGIKTEQSVLDFSRMQPAMEVQDAHDIVSFSFNLEGSFDANKFPFWLWHFLNMNKANIYRVKGIINYEGVNSKMLIQAVGNSHSISPMGDWPRKDPLSNQLVFIGKELKQEEIKESLSQLLAEK